MALTKLNNNGIEGVTALPSSIALGDMVLVSSATASASASIEFTLGDYKEYKFFFVNIHPATDSVNLQFQCSTDGGSSYGVTLTSTAFVAFHNEAGTSTGLDYQAADDLAQSTSFQKLTHDAATGNANDECVTGTLQFLILLAQLLLNILYQEHLAIMLLIMNLILI